MRLRAPSKATEVSEADEVSFNNSTFSSNSLFGSDDDSQALQSALEETPSELVPLDCDSHDPFSCYDRDHEYRVLAGRVRAWRKEVESRAEAREKAPEASRTPHRSAVETRQSSPSRTRREGLKHDPSQRLSVNVKSKNFETLLEKFHKMFDKEITRLKTFRKKKPVRFKDA